MKIKVASIRLKFIGKWGKFDNLEDNFMSFDELPSRMNADDANSFTQGLPSSQDVFGSAPDDDVPF
ncbi:hypothetical protein [Flavobacterium sp. JP2137]|uniref:hypothetical protein n=1 Tax=Flavobacterium sp. JP2137 TaxID=3414510 RepID=UPI003D2FAFC9